jgi:hypothetical protein
MGDAGDVEGKNFLFKKNYLRSELKKELCMSTVGVRNYCEPFNGWRDKSENYFLLAVFPIRIRFGFLLSRGSGSGSRTKMAFSKNGNSMF